MHPLVPHLSERRHQPHQAPEGEGEAQAQGGGGQARQHMIPLLFMFIYGV